MIFGPFIVVYKCAEIALKVTWATGIILWKLPFAFAAAVKGAKKFAEWVRGKKEPSTHGDAAFADDKTLKDLGHFENRGFLSGVTKSGKKVFNHYERAALMLAPPGVGKSQHLIAHTRAILQRPPEKLPHMIFGDAAGEIHATLKDELAAAGVSVFVIDCVDPRRGSRYDVLADLDPSLANRFSFGRQLDAICQLMVPDEPNARNQHFTKFSRLLLKCAITANVRHGKNDKPICDLIDELVDDDDREDLLKRSKAFGDKYLTAVLKSMSRMQSKDEGVSMITTSLQKLEGWNDDAIREASRNKVAGGQPYSRGWRMSDLIGFPTPVALFIRTGVEAAAGDYARMIYGNAINAVARRWDATGKPLDRELEIIMDEAGLTGNCRAIVHAYSRLRKAGVRIRMCFLSMAEFRTTYPEWETLRAGSDIVAYPGSNDVEANEFVSKLTGERTIQNRSKSKTPNGESENFTEQAQRLAKMDQVRGRERGKVIMLLGSLAVDGGAPWRLNKKTGRPESL